MRDIPFVDAHVHLWDLARIRYPWLAPPFADDGPNGSVEPIARTYLLDDYLADAANWDVRGIVHVDAGAEPAEAMAETHWLQAMARTHGMPNAIIAFAALNEPAVEELIVAHAANANVRGIRQIVSWHSDPRRSYTPHDVTLNPQWEQGFGLLARHSLSFDLQAYPSQLARIAALIARHQDVPVIINHSGMAVPSDTDGWQDWRTGMAALAALPNVSVKISGMGFVWRPWDIDQARAYVLETIEIFGTDRAMFASDFPTDKLFGTFDQHLDAYAAIVADFTDGERRALFGRNANRVYRLGLEI